MKLVYAPGACSIGIHFLMEELGKPFTAERLDIKGGEQFQASYLEVNPKSKVPALVRDDGSVLTEFPAIAFWLAKTNPQAGLIPTDVEGEARALEMLDYAVSTIHMQGFSRIFRPGKFAPNEADHDTVKDMGKEIALKAFSNVSKVLADRQFIMGDRLSVADVGLFYVHFWAIDRVKLKMPENCSAYYTRLKARPAAQKAFATEGVNV
jgi:glutathione S-transferase